MARCLTILAGLLMAGPAFAEPVLLKFVHGADQLAFTDEDVARTKLTLDEFSDPAMEVLLADEAAEAFGTFTSQLIGQQIEVFVCDVMVTSPMILSPIETGQLILTGPVLQDDTTLQNKLLAHSCQ